MVKAPNAILAFMRKVDWHRTVARMLDMDPPARRHSQAFGQQVVEQSLQESGTPIDRFMPRIDPLKPGAKLLPTVMLRDAILAIRDHHSRQFGKPSLRFQAIPKGP
jgi:hypothetical protein